MRFTSLQIVIGGFISVFTLAGMLLLTWAIVGFLNASSGLEKDESSETAAEKEKKAKHEKRVTWLNKYASYDWDKHCDGEDGVRYLRTSVNRLPEGYTVKRVLRCTKYFVDVGTLTYLVDYSWKSGNSYTLIPKDMLKTPEKEVRPDAGRD